MTYISRVYYQVLHHINNKHYMLIIGSINGHINNRVLHFKLYLNVMMSQVLVAIYMPSIVISQITDLIFSISMHGVIKANDFFTFIFYGIKVFYCSHYKNISRLQPCLLIL